MNLCTLLRNPQPVDCPNPKGYAKTDSHSGLSVQVSEQLKCLKSIYNWSFLWIFLNLKRNQLLINFQETLDKFQKCMQESIGFSFLSFFNGTVTLIVQSFSAHLSICASVFGKLPILRGSWSVTSPVAISSTMRGAKWVPDSESEEDRPSYEDIPSASAHCEDDFEGGP